MRITILTIFPGMVEPYFQESLMVRAIDRGLVSVDIIDIRDFARDRHRTCDDYPYGGGPGMVLKPEPLASALQSVRESARPKRPTVVLPTPSGIRFDQHLAEAFAEIDHLVLIAGRYEGVDQRVIDAHVDFEVSIGDYVMSSGELAALVIVDTTARLLAGFIRAESLEQESYHGGLLEYPQYTRPECADTRCVPEVLRNGHHEQIERWRSMKRVEKTAAMRPDLLAVRYRQKLQALSLQHLRAEAERRGNDERD